MEIDVGPWSRLLRGLSGFGLLALGAVLNGAVALFYFYVPVSILRPIGVLIALALGVGVSAWIFAIVRFFAAGNAFVRALGIALAIGSIVGGITVYLSLKVAQPNARGACYSAAHPYSGTTAAADLAEGKRLLASTLYRLAARMRPDPRIAEDCIFADTDEERAAHGLCPRVLTGTEQCRCGSDVFPRDKKCDHPECALRSRGPALDCPR